MFGGARENASRAFWWLSSLQTLLPLHLRNLSYPAKHKASHEEEKKDNSPVDGSSRWHPAVNSSSDLPAAGHCLPAPGGAHEVTLHLPKVLIPASGPNCCEKPQSGPVNKERGRVDGRAGFCALMLGDLLSLSL